MCVGGAAARRVTRLPGRRRCYSRCKGAPKTLSSSFDELNCRKPLRNSDSRTGNLSLPSSPFSPFLFFFRPPSLAWEVRKTTSPSKQLQHAADHRSLPAIQRAPQKGEETGKQQTPQKGKGTDRQRAPQNSRRAPQKGEGTVAPQKGEGTEAPQKEEVTGAPQKGEVTGAPQKGEGTGSRPAPQKGEETGSHQSPKKEKRTSLALAEPLSPEVGTDRRCVSGAISAGAGSDGIAEGAGLGEGLVVLTWADRVRGSMAAGRLRPDRPPREAPPTSPGTPPTSPEEASEGGAQPRLCTDGSGSARVSTRKDLVLRGRGLCSRVGCRASTRACDLSGLLLRPPPRPRTQGCHGAI